MSRIRIGVIALLTAASLAACASSSGTPVSNSSAGASALPSSSTTASPTAAGTPVAVDPCQVVTASEASSLAGVTYTQGTEGLTSDGLGKTCDYGSQTLNVFQVLVTQATDAGTAQADWATEEARVQTALQKSASQVPGLNYTLTVTDTSVSGYDKAAVATASATLAGRSFGVSAIYLLKGATFLSYSDLVVGTAAPTSAAMESEAATVLTRLP